MGPTPTDPVEFRKCARDLKALSAVKEYTNEERGGGRDPGARRPGAGRGQFPARSKIFRAASPPKDSHIFFLFPPSLIFFCVFDCSVFFPQHICLRMIFFKKNYFFLSKIIDFF